MLFLLLRDNPFIVMTQQLLSLVFSVRIYTGILLYIKSGAEIFEQKAKFQGI